VPICLKKSLAGVEAHTSYSGGRDEKHSSKLAQAKCLNPSSFKKKKKKATDPKDTLAFFFKFIYF
jgi:hypothetical protein